MKRRKMRRRNPMARELWTPKYRPRVVAQQKDPRQTIRCKLKKDRHDYDGPFSVLARLLSAASICAAS